MKRTREQVLSAIRGSGGTIASIADRLGVAWHTADRLCAAWEATRTELDDERNRIADYAERNVIAAIQDGDLTTSKWFLATAAAGRFRGYGTLVNLATDPGGLVLIRSGGNGE